MSNSVDNNGLYRHLRMKLIHAQICLAEFFKWRRQLKEVMEAETRRNFKMKIETTREDLIEDELEMLKEHRVPSIRQHSRRNLLELSAKSSRRELTADALSSPEPDKEQ